MLVNELPEEKVIIGLRVWNYHKTQKGKVTFLNQDHPDGLDVGITWDDGQYSQWWADGLFIEVCDEP